MQTLQRLSKHIVYLTPVQETDRPVLGAVTGNTRTLVIDAGNSVEHARLFHDELKKEMIKPDYLVLTHSHWDHVFGLEAVQEPVLCQVDTYSNIQMLQKLTWDDIALDQRVLAGTEIAFCADAIKKEFSEKPRNICLPLPDIRFEKGMTVDLGGVTCVIEHIGGDHAGDSCLIYIPEEKVLFLGDCLYANMYAEKWQFTSKEVLRLLTEIEKYDANTYILSHHPHPCTKKEMEHEFKRMKTCAELVISCQGDTIAIQQELTRKLNRDLTEDEIETVGFFVNGYSG
ncbi:MBL fold metallo-hydrolase [Peribacillus psychrosaccharolyticus]|uniref:MBL fold metallo-hydrolase n=1 Tax=Peribacillus psychrosaccharolyticus TaxID=1407 RepID=A0A974NNT5_PERPY|nr:MBL fold metallo-hydrolase [Peribacillus psychrosaccharolyticus]MEC2057219.1 MBL fold metallo-hydrolase [Peribacillus psychrosaccharolyticus]MED3742952.1 MBL fold metallo-hydrolase [Peribacillus psychrosaccharolyticus]QQT00983.1 MBL fold metallo-hydrolase [Peribacillus psychrosaccharolyticus]